MKLTILNHENVTFRYNYKRICTQSISRRKYSSSFKSCFKDLTKTLIEPYIDIWFYNLVITLQQYEDNNKGNGSYFVLT